MVSLQAVHAHNAGLKSLSPGLVAVFVGGTSGISLSTALALARHANAPKIYLIGRNQQAADDAIATMKKSNPSAEASFIQADLSLLKNVDTVCADIAEKEKKLNLLFMTAGFATFKGRDETAEGLDRKLSLHYYARMRFIDRLLPLLRAGSEDETHGRLSRVVSVLDPHGGVRATDVGKLDYSDLDLSRNFNLRRCAGHATLMNDFYLEGLAPRHPYVSFVHAYPSGVPTGAARDTPGSGIINILMKTVFRPFIVPLEESGERHLYAATVDKFASKNEAASKPGAALGSDGTKGSGSYWASWNGEVFAPHKTLEAIRAEGAVEKVTKHTEEVFKRICDEGKRYP